MKRSISRIVEAVARLLANLQVALFARSAGDASVSILDIDNTLADTWPSFLAPFTSHRSRLAGLAVLPGMKAAAHDRATQDGGAVLFLSHRNLWEWPVTFRWLRSNGFAVTPLNLVLVPAPADKVALIARVVSTRPVVVWDDLSAAHETGVVTFYDDVIAAVTDLGVEYHGWDDIVAITGLTLDRN